MPFTDRARNGPGALLACHADLGLNFSLHLSGVAFGSVAAESEAALRMPTAPSPTGALHGNGHVNVIVIVNAMCHQQRMDAHCT